MLFLGGDLHGVRVLRTAGLSSHPPGWEPRGCVPWGVLPVPVVGGRLPGGPILGCPRPSAWRLGLVLGGVGVRVQWPGRAVQRPRAVAAGGGGDEDAAPARGDAAEQVVGPRVADLNPAPELKLKTAI